MSEYADLILETWEYMFEAIEKLEMTIEFVRSELLSDCLAYQN